jgi:hypothetical protein
MQPSAVAQQKMNVRECDSKDPCRTSLIHLPLLQMQPSAVASKRLDMRHCGNDEREVAERDGDDVDSDKLDNVV